MARETVIQLRVTHDEKDAWRRLAEREPGRTLSQYMRLVMNKQVEYSKRPLPR